MIKELNTWQTLVFYAGGLMIVTGLACRMFLVPVSSLLVLPGAVCFSCMQFLCRYEGQNVTLRRLRRQQIVSDVLFLVMGGMMFLYDFGLDAEWLKGNSWMVCLLIASVLQLYTAFRIPQVIEQENKRC